MPSQTPAADVPPNPAALLLAWYDRSHRRLPWRITPPMAAAGERADPYRVWLSEVMLQQTTVQAVKPYFEAFLARWPRVEDLAAAETDAVMKAWAGLGYYARARNLKKCAEAVARDHGGRFPGTEEGLRALPGIGAYTAAAVAAIAFNQPSAVVDGNVERVISRIEAIETPLPASRPAIRRVVVSLTPTDRPGDFAQAMMDLGATICTPRKPVCALCPLNALCAAYKAGMPERFPLKLAKKAKPVRYGTAYVAIAPDGAVYLRKRAETGLLGGMTEVPGSDWTSAPQAEPLSDAPFPADWHEAGAVVHVFTHFELRLAVYRAEIATPDSRLGNGWWQPRSSLMDEALPTVMKKVIATAEPGLADGKKGASGARAKRKDMTA
ncbi:A/G-specific adenine glycosylase [Rhizobium sp. YIM 134829]|uniref:A/G-specific adenine glycosylase n=1 Tax=Rhizobium sp. YIM 134829 TaxID=3390453 RepID=UPI00397D4CE0